MITQDEAVAIARARAAENGWAFSAELEVSARKNWSGVVVRYELETNPGKLGAKARFVIDALTGDVLSEGWLSR